MTSISSTVELSYSISLSSGINSLIFINLTPGRFNNSKAKTMYVSNLFTQPGETDDYKVSDHIKTIKKYINNVDVVIANNKKKPYKTRQKYSKKKKKDQVVIDKREIEKLNCELISDKLYHFSSIDGTIKHDSLKTSYLIFSYLMDGKK